MEKKFQLLFSSFCIFISLVGVVLSCNNSSSDDTERQNEILTFLLQSQPGIQNACESFVRVENLCVNNPANPAIVCSGTLQTQIRNQIQPESLRTDTILERYFRCFEACNQEYNLLSRCQDTKFSNNVAYRTEQRRVTQDTSSGLGAAALNWTNCFESCRSVNGKLPPENSGLRDTGATFPQDWFGGQ